MRFGFHLGAAFQIQDDLLNLVGTEQEYGKEIDGDLYEGKRTLPLIHLIRNARGADRDARRPLPRAATAPSATPRWSREIRALMDAYGSIEFAAAYARGIASAALDAFEEAFAAAAPGPDRDFVRALIPYMLERRV